jgi:methionyl-tRNA formyltransferase
MAACKWNEMDAVELYRRHLALGHVHPLQAEWQGQQVKFSDCLPLENSVSDALPGAIAYSRTLKQLEVTCDKNSVLAIKQLNVPGRKPLTAMDFVNGFLKKVSKDLWRFGNG